MLVNHLHKHQTMPTILYNEECYPLSYDTLYLFMKLQWVFVHEVVRLGGGMWL
jgi:hypothetical protein